MNFVFGDKELERLYTDRSAKTRFSQDIVRAFRKKMGLIDSAVDERDIRNVPGNHMERLQGDRAGQHSLKLNDQFRLILEFHQDDSGRKVAHIIEIVDYH